MIDDFLRMIEPQYQNVCSSVEQLFYPSNFPEDDEPERINLLGVAVLRAGKLVRDYARFYLSEFSKPFYGIPELAPIERVLIQRFGNIPSWQTVQSARNWLKRERSTPYPPTFDPPLEGSVLEVYNCSPIVVAHNNFFPKIPR